MANALERKGRRSMRNIELVAKRGLDAELEHLRFRDAALSVKGGAILAFAGLMLAADLVFLSAAPDSFIAPAEPFLWAAWVALFVLLLASGAATWSLLERARIKEAPASSAYEFIGRVETYHDGRKRYLHTSIALTLFGTSLFVFSVLIGVIGKHFVITPI